MADVKKIPPKTIPEFRNYSGQPEDLAIPERSENRKCTDVGFIGLFVVLLLTTIALTTYGALDTDYSRFLNGYDKCGDSCSIKNEPIQDVNCSGKDLTKKPVMAFKLYKSKGRKYFLLPDECIERHKCNESSFLYFHRCFPQSNTTLKRVSLRIRTFNEFLHDLRASVPSICAMSSIGILFSFGLIYSFRHYTQITVILILILHILGLLSFTAYVWYMFVEDTEKSELLYIGIIAAVMAFFLSIFICYFHDRYSLLIQIFEEAMLAIFQAPLLLLIPLVTLIALGIFVVATVFLSALISTNQDLEESEIEPTVLEYTLSDTGIASITVLGFTTVWLFAFANGCQCMIVAGVVAEYYFAKEKPASNSAVSKSLHILMRYHLGTVVFGSLVVTIVVSARVLVEFIRNHKRLKRVLMLSECCLTCLQQFVDYLSKRAYIQTAMHGESLCNSGIRAARLLWSNLMDTISLDVVGDFIMFCALVLVILIAVGVGLAINFNSGLDFCWAVMIVGATATGVITYFFTQVINVAIETIFLCFCEDKLLNNGKDRPYAMSPKLKAIIDKAQKAARERED